MNEPNILVLTRRVLYERAASAVEGGGAVLRQAGATRSSGREPRHHWRGSPYLLARIPEPTRALMEIKLFTELIDALSKVAGGLKTLVNLPKSERDKYRQTMDETYSLIDTTRNILTGELDTQPLYRFHVAVVRAP